MPYKIVKTFEKGNSKLSAVPSNWEKDGVLHWPRYNENKLRRVESSYPEYNWRKINCKVKRSNFSTILEAEQELDKMCKKSDTETDTDEQYYVTNQKEMMFSQLVQDCIMYENISSVGAVEMKENDVLCQPFQAINSENSLIAIQSPVINTDSNAQQNVTQPDEATNIEHTLLINRRKTRSLSLRCIQPLRGSGRFKVDKSF
ncbi:unnamed protein product [Arctia plantaginis]|uniref:Uncharacterized protein n=1 Tax=Arctia plantaginis TaxID=874455 RepID=A0A8S0ZG57_ARCPL|nr:unnamed protein product [Arctia plantaginis]